MSVESEQSKATVKELVAYHNGIYPEDALEVHGVNEVKDVSNLFVCVYNNNQVGLFTKLNFKTKPHYDYPYKAKYGEGSYYADSIYIGYNSDYVGIKTLHRGENCYNNWESTGYATTWREKTYLANCNMYNGMSFDDMRLIMYEAGELSTPYEFGKATQEQILQVLLFAKRYYSGSYQRKKTN